MCTFNMLTFQMPNGIFNGHTQFTTIIEQVIDKSLSELKICSLLKHRTFFGF